ncbi:MAG: DNA polymerase III subunit gamma/tau [Candidatus Daviesbacteria bacterium]|nr:DNA polymerase III subunit gamma/tau [Candidatus Daviesbacteria bacterium]
MAEQSLMGVFYLKYRPQTLKDLVGQESVKKTLQSAYSANKLSHAYLFVGPRGTGKTSTARILAKMVNCEEKDSPCNRCTTCLSITDGSNLDLIEIDAASNRGIEDIRSLREKIKLSPTSSKKKVYIIDEVHMLTTEAFNALLKTLEEPPSHALFILATTDVSKMPKTILSRVQRLDFKLASPQELEETLSKIIKQEKIDIEEDAIKSLVKKAEGSFRDGVKLLDQIASLDKKITKEVIENIFQESGFGEIFKLINCLLQKDTTAGLTILSNFAQKGVDFKQLNLLLMENLRYLVLIKNGLGALLVEPHLSNENYQSLVELSANFSNQTLIKILDILQKAYEKSKFTSIPSLPLELAVVEICSPESIETVENKQSLQSNDLRELKVVVEDRESKIEEEQIHSQPSIIKEPSPTIHHPPSNSDSPDILKLKEKWTFVLETIRPYNFSLEALLRSISISDCTDSQVIIEVPYSFHQRIMEAPKNRDLLESILSDILGRSIKVSVILGSRPARSEDVANIEIAADDEIIRAAAEIFNSDTVN